MATLLSDNFDRANSTTVIGSPQIGPAPVVQSGVGGISSNQLYGPTSPMHATYDLGTPNVEISFLGSNLTANQASVILGYVSTTNFYLVSFQANNAVQLWRQYPGGSMLVYQSSVKFPTTTTSICKAHHRDGIIRAYVDDVLVFRWQLDEPITSNLHGARTNSSGARIDNLLGTDAPVISEPSLPGGLQTNAQTITEADGFIAPAFGYRGRDTKLQDQVAGA